MARRKYRFPDRATAESAHGRQESINYTLCRLVATLAAGEGFDYVRVADGDYELIVRECGAGFIEGVLVFAPGGQKPTARPILDLELDLQGLKGVFTEDNLFFRRLYSRAIQEVRTREPVESR